MNECYIDGKSQKLLCCSHTLIPRSFPNETQAIQVASISSALTESNFFFSMTRLISHLLFKGLTPVLRVKHFSAKYKQKTKRSWVHSLALSTAAV